LSGFPHETGRNAHLCCFLRSAYGLSPNPEITFKSGALAVRKKEYAAMSTTAGSILKLMAAFDGTHKAGSPPAMNLDESVSPLRNLEKVKQEYSEDKTESTVDQKIVSYLEKAAGRCGFPTTFSRGGLPRFSCKTDTATEFTVKSTSLHRTNTRKPRCGTLQLYLAPGTSFSVNQDLATTEKDMSGISEAPVAKALQELQAANKTCEATFTAIRLSALKRASLCFQSGHIFHLYRTETSEMKKLALSCQQLINKQGILKYAASASAYQFLKLVVRFTHKCAPQMEMGFSPCHGCCSPISTKRTAILSLWRQWTQFSNSSMRCAFAHSQPSHHGI